MFLGDYIHEYPSRPGSVAAGRSLWSCHGLDQYRARYATPQERPVAAGRARQRRRARCGTTMRSTNDYAKPAGQELPAGLRTRSAPCLYRAYWEHMPFPKSARPVGHDMCIVGRLDWAAGVHPFCSTTGQYRDVSSAEARTRRLETPCALKMCPELLERGAPCSARNRSAGSAKAGNLLLALETCSPADT